MTATNNPANPAADREVVSTRIIAAPREQVFAAFSDPHQLAHWWGPKGFTATIHEFDLRPGGQWRLTLHGPDGTDYPNHKEFLEVRPAERGAFRHRQALHDFTMTMTFAGDRDQTTVTWRLRFDSAAALGPIRHLIAEANEQNFDRLADHLQR